MFAINQTTKSRKKFFLFLLPPAKIITTANEEEDGDDDVDVHLEFVVAAGYVGRAEKITLHHASHTKKDIQDFP